MFKGVALSLAKIFALTLPRLKIDQNLLWL